jgi:hypothetical protein
MAMGLGVERFKIIIFFAHECESQLRLTFFATLRMFRELRYERRTGEGHGVLMQQLGFFV